jgi:hypothetical protein
MISTVLNCTVQHSTVLYCTVLYCTVLYWLTACTEVNLDDFCPIDDSNPCLQYVFH